jgi:hypothetical protein
MGKDYPDAGRLFKVTRPFFTKQHVFPEGKHAANAGWDCNWSDMRDFCPPVFPDD